MSEYPFPESFLWGAATAAYQIEGFPLADGAGESIWHRFAHRPGKIADGSTGDIACDHYRHYREDVRLMEKMGLRAYRFSVAWPRIYPQNGQRVNPKGLEFYDRLIDALLEREIIPFLTLYHWDLPCWLDEKGGWPSRDSAWYFADYCTILFEKFGDRVKHWITLNEPWVVAMLGYLSGIFAPGHTDLQEAIDAAHHLLLGHGLATSRFREIDIPDGQIGIALNLSSMIPASEEEKDIHAAERQDGHLNRWFLDPLFRGSYPADMADWYTERGVRLSTQDMEVISAPMDFLGVNYYAVTTVAHHPDNSVLQTKPVPPEDRPLNAMGWEIHPEGLYGILTRIQGAYRDLPIYITENGLPLRDDQRKRPDLLDDSPRIDYLRDHILQVHRAIQDGVSVKGYFVWSLMDNFEWASGCGPRFGLIRIDYPTQERTFKKSAHWYRGVIADPARGLSAPAEPSDGSLP